MSPAHPTAQLESGPLAGLRVVAFENRMADPMAELIRRQGGSPRVVPAMKEVPITSNPEALAFAHRLISGDFDLVIFLTGVGARYLAESIKPEYSLDQFTHALRRVDVVVRGPKPQSVMREWGVPVALAAPEPNTWRDLLAALTHSRPLQGCRIAIQEYGQPNDELAHALADQGAHITRIAVYRWSLPDDLITLRRTIRSLVALDIGAALFTSAQQVTNLFDVARQMRLETSLHQALANQVILASIGPTTNEALARANLNPDIVPEHPKMGHLVQALANRWATITKAASLPPHAFDLPRPHQGPTPAACPRPEPSAKNHALLHNSPFLRACRGEPAPVTPIWLMRQAGRYMLEYRTLRARVGFLQLCKTPELAAEVTVSAAEQLGVDAAILFADILLILQPLGLDLEFSRGDGPVIHNPIREPRDVDRIQPLTCVDPLHFVPEAVRQIRAALRPDIPLIGFAGAPFTLACYAIEGGGSRHYDRAKAFFFQDPGAWHALMERLVDSTVLYLNAQADAGAQALQLFDSWVGTLAPHHYLSFVQPHMKRLFAQLNPDIPTIHFGTDTSTLLEHQRDAGGHVIGLDWRIPLDLARNRLGHHVAVQGNLDPAVLLAPIPVIREQARRILDHAGGRPGHIFNLGHGILPTTPVDHVRALVDFVHAATDRRTPTPTTQPA